MMEDKITTRSEYGDEMGVIIDKIINNQDWDNKEKGKLLIEIKSDIEKQLFEVDKYTTDGVKSIDEFFKQFGKTNVFTMQDVIASYTDDYIMLIELKKKIELCIFDLQFKNENLKIKDVDTQRKSEYTCTQINVLTKILENKGIIPQIENKTTISLPLNLLFCRDQDSIRKALSTPLENASNSDIQKVSDDLIQLGNDLKKYL